MSAWGEVPGLVAVQFSFFTSPSSVSDGQEPLSSYKQEDTRQCHSCNEWQDTACPWPGEFQVASRMTQLYRCWKLRANALKSSWPSVTRRSELPVQGMVRTSCQQARTSPASCFPKDFKEPSTMQGHTRLSLPGCFVHVPRGSQDTPGDSQRHHLWVRMIQPNCKSLCFILYVDKIPGVAARTFPKGS